MRVSVIVAAFNVKDLITRAIESVRAQTFGDWELFVVDDASHDGTADVVASLARADPRIRLIRQESNLGPSAARNRGIGAARGDWIAILDADDAWLPERLEKLLNLATETRSDFVADDLILFDDAYQQEAGLAFNFPDRATRLQPEHLFPREEHLRRRSMAIAWSAGLLKPLIRRGFLIDNGLRYEETLRSFEDLLLYAELMFHGARAVVTHDAYYIYTLRVGPLSGEKAKGSRSTTSLEALLWIADTLAQRYKVRLTPEVDRGIARLRQFATRRWIASEITRFRQARDFWRLAVFMIRHPQGAVRYALTSRTWARTFKIRPMA